MRWDDRPAELRSRWRSANGAGGWGGFRIRTANLVTLQDVGVMTSRSCHVTVIIIIMILTFIRKKSVTFIIVIVAAAKFA